MMVLTPWGRTEGLRDRQLPRGRSDSREEVRQNQRQRLLAAMVGCCEEKGWESTSVADLLEVSGVSRATFYTHFDDKLDCFATAVRETLAFAVTAISSRSAAGDTAEERARSALESFVEEVVAQPAAARMCLVASLGAGELGVAPLREAVDAIGRLAHEALEQMPDRAGMPEELARAIVGGVHRAVYTRLQERREGELPALVDPLWRWAMNYPVPPQPLRARRRRGRVTPTGSMPPFAGHDPEQRIIRGFAAVVAEKGYGQTTIADVATAASISQGTFYEYFEGKADAMAAALDSSGAQMLAVALPAARRAQDWPTAVRAALGACCTFLAAEPAFARLRAIEVYAAGPMAIAQRDSSGIELLGILLGPAFEDTPEVPEVAMEAIVGAIYGVLYDRVFAGETINLAESAPLLTYLTLAPFLGAEVSCEVALGSGRGSRSAGPATGA